LLAWTCFGSDFEFADFALGKGLAGLGSAHRVKNFVRLTSADRFQAGAIWYWERQPVSAGFETSFSFKFTDQDLNQGGADGLAFVVQNEGERALGGLGASGGFLRSDDGAPGGLQRGIGRSVAVFFDTYQNGWDAGDNFIAICTQTPATSLRWPPVCQSYTHKLKQRLKNGKVHTARVVYQPPLLSVYLDDSQEPVTSASVDVARMVGGDGKAWVGFTGSTGGSWENHDLLRWKFQLAARPDVSSSMSAVDSSISFTLGTCLPERRLCTPEKVTVEEKGPGQFHVTMPAHLEWSASVPNTEKLPVRVFNVTGTVCWDPRLRESSGCNGPAGNGVVPGAEAEGAAGFISPKAQAGSLVTRSLNGRVWFSVNDRTGEGFNDNEGFFEFDVSVGRE